MRTDCVLVLLAYICGATGFPIVLVAPAGSQTRTSSPLSCIRRDQEMQIPNSITWYPRSHWQRSWRGWCTRPSPDHRLSTLVSSISFSLFLSFFYSFSLFLSRHPRQQLLVYAPRAHRIIPFLRVPGISSLRRVLENIRPLNANAARSCTDCSNGCNLEEIELLDVARNPRVVKYVRTVVLLKEDYF